MKRRDSIIDDLHKLRERIGRAHDFDVDRIAATIREHEHEAGRTLVEAVPKPAKRQARSRRVEEVRRNRAAIAREHGNDLDAIVAAFQREEATSEVPAVSFPPKPFVKRPVRSESGKTSRASKARGVSKGEKRKGRSHRGPAF